MVIQVVSFKSSSKSDSVRNLTDIVNSSEADLIVFSGAQSLRICDLQELPGRITNRKPSAFLDARGRTKYNSLFLLRNRLITSLNSRQMFSTSSELENDATIAEKYIDELAHRRMSRIGGLKALLMVCGENNIAVSRKPGTPEHYAEFRIADKRLKANFEKILCRSDIIVNPTHSMNSRPWLYHERAEYFSSNGRIYVMSANGNDLSSPNIQYVYQNGERKSPNREDRSKDCLCSYYYL